MLASILLDSKQQVLCRHQDTALLEPDGARLDNYAILKSSSKLDGLEVIRHDVDELSKHDGIDEHLQVNQKLIRGVLGSSWKPGYGNPPPDGTCLNDDNYHSTISKGMFIEGLK